MNLARIKNRTFAKLITRFPSLAGQFVDAYEPVEYRSVPWTPVTKKLNASKVAIVTTAGVHNKDQTPFDMADRDGDPSFREIDARNPVSSLVITHDYYDHTDADKDINIVFPLERLKELETEGIISKVADYHYGFMGHIKGRHIQTLINEYAPEVARRLIKDHVDVVLLSPG